MHDLHGICKKYSGFSHRVMDLMGNKISVLYRQYNISEYRISEKSVIGPAQNSRGKRIDDVCRAAGDSLSPSYWRKTPFDALYRVRYPCQTNSLVGPACILILRVYTTILYRYDDPYRRECYRYRAW